jgi:hypothetical protein
MIKMLYHGQPDQNQAKGYSHSNQRGGGPQVSSGATVNRMLISEGLQQGNTYLLDQGTNFSPRRFANTSGVSTPTPAAEEENIFNFPKEIPSRQKGKTSIQAPSTIRQSCEKIVR